MAGKKKKKIAPNPARGYATTSVASKPKVVDAEPLEPGKVEGLKEGTNTPVPAITQSKDTKNTKELHEMTPEQLEEHLETSELQLLVEKHSAKVRREASRQVSKLQVDRRKIRSEAQALHIQDWLSDDITDAVLHLIEREMKQSSSESRSVFKTSSEEDVTMKLWTLQQALGSIGVSPERIREVLMAICDIVVEEESSSQTWGLIESLEWLTINCDDEELATLFKDETITANSSQPSRPDTPNNLNPALNGTQESPKAPQRLLKSSNESPSRDRLSDPLMLLDDPSEPDSDMEGEEMISKYLSLKSRLYDVDPGSVDPIARGKRVSKQSMASSTVNSSNPQAQKIKMMMQRIENDILFDKQEADYQWVEIRNKIAQTKAFQKKITPSTETKPDRSSSKIGSKASNIESSASTPETTDNSQDEDDLLGGMFQLGSDPIASETHATEDSNHTTNRDFGEHSSGQSPRRILEDAIRSRDPGVRLKYTVVSPTVYSARHSLSIEWSKLPQIVSAEAAVQNVTYECKGFSTTLTMTTISTPSEKQSESYISTSGIFILFSAASPEDKTYMRLPSVWRDLYREFSDIWRNLADAEARTSVKELRTLVREQKERAEGDSVVLLSNFKKRQKEKEDNKDSVIKQSATNGISDTLKGIWDLKASTESFQRMLQVRSELPISKFRVQVLSAVDHNQVVILCGETGCGKSTQVPSFILEHELKHGHPCKIYCTEPRRISAISLAQRVSEELGEDKNAVGTSRSLVGYSIRLESATTSATRLVYATVGIVLRMLESSQDLVDVTHLIIDEVHERSIDTDFLLIVLQSLLDRRPTLKVILMSATVDAEKFSSYLSGAPILTVPGRTFPVQTRFLEDALELVKNTHSVDTNPNDSETSGDEELVAERKISASQQEQGLTNYSVAVRNKLLGYDEYKIDYSLILSLIQRIASDPVSSSFSKAFLVFLPGIAEIRRLNDMLLSHAYFDKGWLIYPLHSTISSEDQQQAFLVPPVGVKKVVIATNIAETGITIPDVTCVIDTGKHKEMRFDERRQLSRLVQSFISRANAKQRRGRAGRVQEGLCYHLFTKYRHDNLMNDQQTPEMLRLSLQDLVMRTKICKLGDIEMTLASALDPPTSKNIRRAIDALVEVEALTSSEELTPLGRQLSKLPLDAHLGKLVLLSSIFNCVDVAITFAAILSSKSPFHTPLGDKKRAELIHQTFNQSDSDLFTAYNAYKAWKTVCQTPGQSEFQYCRRHFLSSQNLNAIEDLKSQFISSLADAGFLNLTTSEKRTLVRSRNSRNRTFNTTPLEKNVNTSNDLFVSSIVATSFYPKILRRDGKGWRTIANHQTVSLHPTSVARRITSQQSHSTYLSYYNIMQSSGSRHPNAHHLTPAPSLPLVLLAGSLAGAGAGSSPGSGSVGMGAGAGAASFLPHAGVVLLDNHRLKFSVPDNVPMAAALSSNPATSANSGKAAMWRRLLVLKWMRKKLREIVLVQLREPGRGMTKKEVDWMDLFVRMFQRGNTAVKSLPVR